MIRLVMIGGIGAALTLTAASAAAQGRGWQEPECELNTGHYLVNSAQLYLKNASTTRFADQRERDLRDARRVLLQALDEGRADDGSVWYLLGRWYKIQNDVAGMDSAFDKASTLQPGCRQDIQKHRRQVWVPILNRGVEAQQSGNTDLAKEQYRKAMEVYEGEPSAHYYMAQLYASQGEVDSAVQYYRTALRIARDSTNLGEERFREIRERSLFNVARLLHRAEQYDSAAVWYQRYLEVQPDDAEALTGLAQVYAAAGREAEAVAIYDSVLARADSLPPFDLFQAGVALFNANRYERAARAFETALARNPHFRQRETLFNLANTYLSLGNADTTREAEMAGKMQPVVMRLVEVDPASVAAKRLLAAVYQLRDQPDSTLAVLEMAQNQAFDVTVSTFAPAGRSAWDVRGIITNNRDSGTVTVPELVFEFIDNDGSTVATQTVPAQTLEAGGIVPFRMTAQGENIVGWRYRIGTAS